MGNACSGAFTVRDLKETRRRETHERNTTMIRVYKYHLGPPSEGADLVREQMLLAHRYRNVLTEIERARRAAIRELNLAAGDVPALTVRAEEATACEEVAVRAVKAQRAKTRSRSETDQLRQALRAARSKRSECVRMVREARALLRDDPELKEQNDAINQRAKIMVRGARALSGVFWGTYLLVEDAAQASAKAPLYDGLDPNDPGFVRASGDGQLGVQIQRSHCPMRDDDGHNEKCSTCGGSGQMMGMDAAKVFHGGTWLKIDPMDELAWHSQVRGERRRAARTQLHMRVKSNENGAPIWATWPMVMHRPLPPGARIKSATVSLRAVGPRREWSVEITMDLAKAPLAGLGGTGTVGIDIGWRVIGDQVRVACWRGKDGISGELRLDSATLSRLHLPEELRGRRDKNFDLARAALLLALPGLTKPAWLEKAAAHLSHWKSAARLAHLAMTWRKNRFDGDKEAYDALEAWRYHDHHLWAWETAQRTSGLRHRRNVYRVFAAELARAYGTVVFEDFDLRTMARRAPVEAPAENEVARSNRFVSALSELREAIANAFASRGGVVEKVPAHDTTRECHLCHHVEAFDAAAEISHTCAGCAVTWDQDENAAINILARFERDGGNEKPGGARGDEKSKENGDVPERRRAKGKRKKKERQDKSTTARDPGTKAAE
jgi:hypothetical protein